MQKIISVVIPVFNEERNIPLIARELEAVFRHLPYSLEILFVNDGSHDGSWSEIAKLANASTRVRGLSLSRNFGHQAALEAGLRNARGDAVISMDGDLQHPPGLIPDLIGRWESGFDIVNTRRVASDQEPLIKRITSRLFYKFINALSDIHIEPGSADFRLLGRHALTQLNTLREKDVFYRGLIQWIGFRHTSLDYSAQKRSFGKTSYTYARMFSFAQKGITSFSELPMKMIGVIGSLLFIASALVLVYMLYYRYAVDASFFSNTAFLILFMLLNSGFIIAIVGIMSLYQTVLLKEARNRPSYIISEETPVQR
jgi:dolichol-phosphate mannosyltransferase